MERLPCGSGSGFSAVEAAIHLARYGAARQLCAGKRVLDVACGEGYGSWLMAQWGAVELHGVDVAADAVAKADATFRAPGLRFQCRPAETIADAFEAGHFDLAVSLETIEHLEDPVAFLSGLRRVVAPDGAIVVSCPNDHWYYREPHQRNPFHVRKYTFDEFREMAEAVLGPAAGYLMGAVLGGYVNWPVSDPVTGCTATSYQAMLHARDVHNMALVPSEEVVSWQNCSYFLGVWGADPARAAGGVGYLSSMDSAEAPVRLQQVDGLRAAYEALRREMVGELRREGMRRAALVAERDFIRDELVRRRDELRGCEAELVRHREETRRQEEEAARHAAEAARLRDELEAHEASRADQQAEAVRALARVRSDHDAVLTALRQQEAYYRSMAVVRLRAAAGRLARRLGLVSRS